MERTELAQTVNGQESWRKSNIRRLSRCAQAARHPQVLAQPSLRHPLLLRSPSIIRQQQQYDCPFNQKELIYTIGVSHDACSYNPIEVTASSSLPRCSFRSNAVVLGFPRPDHPSPLLSSMFLFQREDFNKGCLRALGYCRNKTILVYKASICSFSCTKRVSRSRTASQPSGRARCDPDICCAETAYCTIASPPTTIDETHV